MIMSIFASQVQKTLPIPHDPPHTVTIRKLTGKQLQRALKARQAEVTQDMRDLGGAAFLKELRTLGDEDLARAAKVVDPFASYDPDVLIQAGTVSWTHDRACDLEAKDDLDDETREWLSRAIYELSRRRTPEEAKND